MVVADLAVRVRPMSGRATSNRVCDYGSCKNHATVLWHNGENMYCREHADQFKAASDRIEPLIRGYEIARRRRS
jgi:hypothetical protein